MNTPNPLLFRLGLFATILALCVVVLGAYVRLSHAGLGCPDWPGCYGHLDVPQSQQEVDQANQAYPERPVEQAKAWKEMLHRYVAGVLGLLILAITIIAWRQRQQGVAVGLPSLLLGLVIFQALLGMWTVTLLLKPFIVTAHLAGGMTTLALLWWLTLTHSRWCDVMPIDAQAITTGIRKLAIICLLLLALQILLGGWTSTNYAALACYGFPQCSQQWWPAMNFKEAFVLWRGLGIDYEGGILDHPARTAIHMTHRLGAVVVLAAFAVLIIRLWRIRKLVVIRRLALLLLVLLLMQLGLGIANVTQGLPLVVASAHNAGAALLLLCLLSVFYFLLPSRLGKVL